MELLNNSQIIMFREFSPTTPLARSRTIKDFLILDFKPVTKESCEKTSDVPTTMRQDWKVRESLLESYIRLALQD